MLYGTGLTPTDLQKPQVGICSMWWEGNTCNMHLDKLASHVKEGVQGAGLVGLRFNTIGVSDGISMVLRRLGIVKWSMNIFENGASRWTNLRGEGSELDASGKWKCRISSSSISPMSSRPAVPAPAIWRS